mmetsp:Transcript_864/g.531  ORF Transcript_864/g.531 Transcript_864/m.531 type:complete len:168 (-) Transcript_864:637-1140(-)
MKLFAIFAAIVAVTSAHWKNHGHGSQEMTAEEIEAHRIQKEKFFHRIQFVEGFAYGFAVYDNLSETATCMKEGFSFVKEVKDIKVQYKLGEIASSEVMFRLYNAFKAVPAQWKECFEAPTDLLKFDDWLLKIRDLKIENVWSAMFAIKADFEQGMADLVEEKFFQAG